MQLLESNQHRRGDIFGPDVSGDYLIIIDGGRGNWLFKDLSDDRIEKVLAYAPTSCWEVDKVLKEGRGYMPFHRNVLPPCWED